MATTKTNGGTKTGKPSKASEPQKSSEFDVIVERGAGGELHQVAGNGVPPLTTAQGIPVSDDYNTSESGRARARPA